MLLKIQFQNHPCGVVDNCGITGCGVWRRKIAFDPRFSTFETRFPDKGTNIKRHLTPGAPWPFLQKAQKSEHNQGLQTKYCCVALISRRRKQYKLYVVENVVLFLFHKSHLLFICGSSCPQIFPILEKPSARSLLVHPMFQIIIIIALVIIFRISWLDCCSISSSLIFRPIP